MYSSLLLLISMSLGDPGSAIVDEGVLFAATSARVRSAVNMLVGCKSGEEWSRVYSLN